MNRDLLRRLNRARRFPDNTCPASRHAQIIGEALAKGRPYPMLTEEARHCGESILWTVCALYEARTELEHYRLALAVRKGSATDADGAVANEGAEGR